MQKDIPIVTRAIGETPDPGQPVRCRDFAPEFDPELINRPSDLVNRCRLLCVLGSDAVSSHYVSPGLFDRALSQPALLDPWILVATGVHFDVFGPGIGDSVRAGPLVWMSVDTGDGDRLPVTTVARPLAGGSGCCGWLQFVTQGAGPLAPPISVRTRTIVPGSCPVMEGWEIYIWIVYTRQGSVAVLQVTRSLLFRILLCYLIVVCFLSCSKNLTKSLPGLLRRPVHFVRRRRCTVSVYLTSGAMTVGVASPEFIMERAQVLCELGITGSGRTGHLSHPRRLGPEGALRGRRTDPGAAR